jgi:streptomycin 6-kinase
MTFHWVGAVRRDDGAPAVLKLAVPGSNHQAVEATALRAWSGRGAAELLAHDADRGVLLMRRARPGRPLRHLVPDRDAEATTVLRRVMRRLHEAPVPEGGVPPLTDVRSSFTDYLAVHPGAGPLPRSLVEQALGRFDELTASAPASVLLHGDLHHDNVLSDETSESGWMAIDPHGRIGDPGFEVGTLLYNPDPSDRSDELLRLVPCRVDQLADELGMQRDRVVGWGFVAATLSEVWSTEDSLAYLPTRALDVARLLESRPPLA